jgi:hypothetical protein
LDTHRGTHKKWTQSKSTAGGGGAPVRSLHISRGRIPASLDLNDLTFPEYAGLASCGSRSRSVEAIDTGDTGEFKELSSDGPFDLPAEESARTCGQPSQFPVHTPNRLYPPTVPANFITFHNAPPTQCLPGVIRPRANGNDGSQSLFQFQQPLSNEDFQSPSGADSDDVNNKFPVDQEEFTELWLGVL